jgi:hypothetical protein
MTAPLYRRSAISLTFPIANFRLPIFEYGPKSLLAHKKSLKTPLFQIGNWQLAIGNI